jgi:hypothetical protein
MDMDFFAGAPLINIGSFQTLIVKLVLDLVAILILGYFIYFKIRRNRGYLFTLLVFNVVVFFICAMFNSVTLSIGFSFGIFAIFSILRYRTISIPIREMTYIFIAISLGIINSLSNSSISVVELLFTNTALIALTFIFEKACMKNEQMKYIIYEKINLVKPERYEELVADLKVRTGLNINRVEIGKIDFLRDISELRVYFTGNHQGSSFINEEKDHDDDD